MTIHAMPLVVGALCVMVIFYRYYHAFIAAKVAVLDDSRKTPAYTMYDGQNYFPTNKWVLFGHHFAAITGAGPLIGPVLAAQFGVLPGYLWILIGAVLAGAVHDFIIFFASVRHGGKSLAELEGAAFLRGRDESDGDWNEKVALPLRARIAELLLMHELMACGHQKAYWVPDHFFSAMKPCDEPYDVYRCEICKRKVGVHTDGGGTAWIMNAHCSACQREKELVEECISIVIYTPSRHDDFVRADIVDAIRARLGVK